MVQGKTIQLYLPDGNPKGIKKCKINESIGRAIFIPRNELDKAKKFEELQQQGVYFLIKKEDEEKFKFYIGEAESLIQRVLQHDNPDKEWNYVICFYSATNNINKAHVKFLESICYKKINELGRQDLVNGNCPPQPKITEEEENLLLSFFEEMRILIGVLGYPIFEEIKKAQTEEEIFYCRRKSIEAKGNLTEEGFVIYKGSHAEIQNRPSSNQSINTLRDSLINTGVLKKEEESFIFTEDYVSSSPSMAAAIITGGNENGWIVWKNKEGKTLDELKRKK